jgi:Domain of unknown function (DUF4287)
MSFQAYIDNVKTKTGLGPAEFKALAEAKGFISDGAIAAGVNATQITNWLKADFSLGHGHAMAIYALIKGTKQEKLT